MPIHPTFNFVPCSQKPSCIPNHHQPTTMLCDLIDLLRSNMFSISNPTSRPIIWIKLVYLCLVTENDVFPIIKGPIFIPLSKPQMWESVITTQNLLPLLHLCTQSSLSQSTTHNDVRQQSTCSKSKLFCCHKFSSNMTFSNKDDMTPLLSVCKKLWTPSSLSLNLAPYILPHTCYKKLVHAH
jgi:hypothetical protein